MDDAIWEAICNRCGKCCYEKIDLGAGVVKYLDEPCRHLDTETKLCKVYDRRHDVEPDCMRLTENLVRNLHWLPEDCAYVRYIRFQDTVTEVRSATRAAKGRHKSKRRR